MPYMVTFTINIPPMLVYMPYMDPMGYIEGTPVSKTSMPVTGDPYHERDGQDSRVYRGCWRLAKPIKTKHHLISSLSF